jgi:hypothetical protein
MEGFVVSGGWREPGPGGLGVVNLKQTSGPSLTGFFWESSPRCVAMASQVCTMGAATLAGLAGSSKVKLVLYMLSREHMARWAIVGKSCWLWEGKRVGNRSRHGGGGLERE